MKYRLVLLDAAHAADGTAANLAAAGQNEFGYRCAELAKQMRSFAGHSNIVGAETPTFRARSTGRGLVAFFRRAKS